MGKKKTTLSRRAWNKLRLALLWARKGSVFKRGLMMDLRLLRPSYIKSLYHNPAHSRRETIQYYREREFSFNDTPIFHFKMHRPTSMRFLIPCLNTPSVDFDFEDNNVLYNNHGRNSFLSSGNDREVKEEEYFDNSESGDDGRRSSATVSGPEELQEEEQGGGGGIDLRAEEFIAKFYEQMKLQRQTSYLQYHEMLNRGTS